MFKIFTDTGLIPMSILTIFLVAIFFAAWKAPRWVKEIGKFALMFAFLCMLLGLRHLFSVFAQVSSDSTEGLFDLISPNALFMTLNINLIPLVYGIIIYMVSLIIRMIQKPRL